MISMWAVLRSRLQDTKGGLMTLIEEVARVFRFSDPASQPRLTEVNRDKLQQWEVDRMSVADALGIPRSIESKERKEFYALCEGHR